MMERVRTEPEEKESKYYFRHPFNNEEVVIELTVNFKTEVFEIEPMNPEAIKYEGGFAFGKKKSNAAINSVVCMLIEDATNFAIEKLKESKNGRT